MGTTAKEQLPLEVGPLGNFEARMMRNVRAAVEDWDEVCSALGAWEAQYLTRSDSGGAKDRHRAWVMELLSWGRFLRQMTADSEFPDRTLAARVSARLRHLEDKLALWHREMTPADEERILRTAFP